jgi:hypothetical protein
MFFLTRFDVVNAGHCLMHRIMTLPYPLSVDTILSTKLHMMGLSKAPIILFLSLGLGRTGRPRVEIRSRIHLMCSRRKDQFQNQLLLPQSAPHTPN